MNTHKKKIRQSVAQNIKSMNSLEKKSENLWILDKLYIHSKIKKNSSLLVYSSLADEVDLSPLFPLWISKGIVLFFPCHMHTQKESLLPVQAPVHVESKRSLSVYSQDSSCASSDPQNISCVLVPGRAFHKNGLRLGRGGGYYDRLLSRIPKAYKIGIGFSCQIKKKIPQEPHDIFMDELLICPSIKK